MFQKIHKQLDLINENLREQGFKNGEAQELTAGLFGQLESIKEALLQNNVFLAQLTRQKKNGYFLAILTPLIFLAAMFAISFFSYRVYQYNNAALSAAVQDMNRAEHALGLIRGDNFQAGVSYMQASDRHMAALDSLIIRQDRSIRQMKDLNRIAVRDLTRLTSILQLSGQRSN